MNKKIKKLKQATTAILLVILGASFAQAEPSHGIAMYGQPALPADFTHLPHANPSAPKGGKITLGNTGGFNSLNPYIRKGSTPWQLPFLTHDSLMGRSRGEPFTLYGLIAESVETDADRRWVEYTLRPEARFSDGTPVTVEDVIFSFELLGTQGKSAYRSLYDLIESIEQTGPNKVRINFSVQNRELALLTGIRPILSKAQWQGKDFANAPLQDYPMGSGPYVIAEYDVGNFVRLNRNPDYWAADLPIRRGTFNFDEIKIDFYGDSSVMFEAFKAGEISAVREINAERWKTRYLFPAVQRGDIVQSTIPHGKPSGMTGFVMNTRRAPFDDWRIRDAMISAFNFEYINDTITGGAQPRITSYFSGTMLAKRAGNAVGRVEELLTAYQDTLPKGAIKGYELPIADGSARNRAGIRKAMQALELAGYTAADGTMRRADGTPLTFTILLRQGAGEDGAIADIYVQSLARLGIKATVEVVDNAQYVARINTFDFDMTPFRRAASLSPGNEQKSYWGSAAADQEGSRNLMGVRSAAIDAAIQTMLSATTETELIIGARALDRLLMAGRYVIPFWDYREGRIAHVRQMKYPETLPIYGDGPDWMPQFWWWED